MTRRCMSSAPISSSGEVAGLGVVEGLAARVLAPVEREELRAAVRKRLAPYFGSRLNTDLDQT